MALPKDIVSDAAEPAGCALPASHVLVVDDSRAQRRLLNSTLSRIGYTVFEAESGEEALQICRQQSFDLIVSDWMMPGMDGPEFCAQFRAISIDRYAYFILLTSKNERSAIAKGLEVGADDFITKPVNAVELRARMAAGARIVAMQRELTNKHVQLQEAFTRIRALYDAIDADLAEGKRLQQSLLRERYKDLGAAELSLLLRSAGHVGGDLVGFFPTSGTQVGLFAIDVSGHGITSALLTARLAGYLSPTSLEQNIALRHTVGDWFRVLPTDEVVRRLNELMFQDIDTEHYFTICLAVLDLHTGEVTMTQAGHPHPAVQRRDGQVEFLGDGDMPVGLVPGVDYSSFTFRLEPGDRLLMFSDGFTECPAGPNATAMVEEEGLTEMLTRNQELTGPNLLEALQWDLVEFYGSDELPDDVSAVLVEYHGWTHGRTLVPDL